MSRSWANTLRAWEDLRAIPYEFRELDAERILVLHRWKGRGKTSGLEVGEVFTNAACVFHISDGMVAKMVCYWNADRAFSDLGLAGQ